MDDMVKCPHCGKEMPWYAKHAGCNARAIMREQAARMVYARQTETARLARMWAIGAPNDVDHPYDFAHDQDMEEFKERWERGER